MIPPWKHRASHELAGVDSRMLREMEQPAMELVCGCVLFPFRLRVYTSCREDHGLTLPLCCSLRCDNREGCHLRPPVTPEEPNGDRPEISSEQP